MSINFFSRIFIKLVGISLTLFFPIVEINTINKQIKAETKLTAASEKDLFLYRQMGASYLCISSRAEVDFDKGIGVASATFANVIVGKHGGVIEALGNEKLDEKRLYNAGTFQIIGSALSICPESIPDKIKKDYEKRLKQLTKENKK